MYNIVFLLITSHRCTEAWATLGPKFKCIQHQRRRWCLLWMPDSCKSTAIQYQMDKRCKYRILQTVHTDYHHVLKVKSLQNRIKKVGEIRKKIQIWYFWLFFAILAIFWHFLSTFGHKEGDDIYFECLIHANPPPSNIKWTRDVSTEYCTCMY